MKKILLCLLALVLTVVPVFAQQSAPFTIEKSESFDEPHPARWSKVLQMKNGNTIYLHSPKREGVVVDVYDKQRKHIAEQHLESKIWNPGDVQNGVIYGVFEIRGEVVFFVNQDRAIYRIRLNGTNGSLVKEDVLSEKGASRLYAEKEAEFERTFVEKDDESDCYAIFLDENMGTKYVSDLRIRVLHFDGNHKKLSDQIYKKTGVSFSNIRLCSGVVDSDKSVYFVLEATNDKLFGKKPSHLLVARLNAGEGTFKNTVIETNLECNELQSEVVYNRSAGTLQLLALALVDKKAKVIIQEITKYYLPMIVAVDVKTMQVVSIKQVTLEKVNEYLQRHMGNDARYVGMPQLMMLNRDNTRTLLFESGASGGLGTIGISQISDSGEEISGYAIEKLQFVTATLPLMFQHRRIKGYFRAPQMAEGQTNRFISYNYLPTEKCNYVVYNDISRNVNSSEDEKHSSVRDPKDAGMVCCKLGASDVSKSFVFGEPNRVASTYSYIDAADYNNDTHVYATIVVERDGHRSEARLVWLSFE